MGFLRKAAKKPQKDEIISEEEVKTIDDFDEDDFDLPPAPQPTRKEFHEMAEKQLEETILEACDNADNTADDKESTDEDESSEDTDVISSAENDVAREDNDSKNVVDAAADEYRSLGYNDNFENASEEQPPKKNKKEKAARMNFGEFYNAHKKGVRITAACFGVLIAACLGLYIYGCATVPSGVMGRNIYIEDINVSNLTYDEALKKVKDAKLLDDCSLTLVSGGKTFMIDGLDIGLNANIEDTVGKTMRYGKTGNIFIDGLANALQVLHRHTVLPSADLNDEILKQKISEFGIQLYGELVEHKLEFGDNELICTPGHSGFSGEIEEAYNEVIKAIKNENFSRIRVTLKSAAPADLTAEDIDAFTYSNPQDAHFEVKDNEVITVPEVWGRYFDDVKAIAPLAAQIKEGGEVIRIPYRTTAPKVTADELNQKLFNATLGSYQTGYGGSTANRAANVANAASKINGKVLAPGEVFSFNDTVGKRSAANGFFPAPEYSNGQTVIGIGGGTCQVSSTLYNAVLYSDLAIVSRLNHMFAVGYCPLGQDATVSDSGVDFKFSNNTDYPIKIVATTGGGSIKVSIVGTQRDVVRTVKIQNNVSYSGGNRNVRSYRYVYDPDGNLLRKDDLGNSYYMTHAPETTQAPASSAPAASSAPSTPVATPIPATPAPVAPEEPPAVANGGIESN